MLSQKVERKDVRKGDIVNMFDRYDLLIYTPVICAGNSFTKSHFNMVMGYFTSRSCIVEMSVQQMFRIRQLIDNKMILCIQSFKSKSLPATNHQEMMKLYKDSYKNHVELRIISRHSVMLRILFPLIRLRLKESIF